jgi:hypothetical protein
VEVANPCDRRFGSYYSGLVFVLSSICFVTANIGGGHPVSCAFSALAALAFVVAAMKLIRKLN